MDGIDRNQGNDLDILRSLERQTDALVQRCEQLKAQNDALITEQQYLLEKNQSVADRIEKLLERFKQYDGQE